jgi:hypothetical protein
LPVSLQDTIFILKQSNIKDIDDIFTDIIASNFDQVLENQNLKNQIKIISV